MQEGEPRSRRVGACRVGAAESARPEITGKLRQRRVGAESVPEHRRAGLGEMLLKRIVSRSRAMGIERLFVLTTRTSDWFRERGFRAVAPEELPRQKREMYDVERRSKVFMKSL